MSINSQSRTEDILNVILDHLDPSVLQPPQSRVEALLLELYESGGGGGGGGSLPIVILVDGEYDTSTGVPTINDPQENTLYLAPSGSSMDLYAEWVYVNDNWNSFGTVSIDLSDYVRNTDYANSTTGGVIKLGQRTSSGLAMGSDGKLFLSRADISEIKAATSTVLPIVPSHQHESVFFGLAKAAGDLTQAASSNSVGNYTDGAKQAIKSMFGIEEGGGGGTSDYTDLTNKPSINGVTLTGNKTLSDLGAASLVDVAQSVDAALQEAKDSGDFDGPQGPKGDPGAQGPAGGNITVAETLISGENYELELDDNGEDLAGEIVDVKTDISENIYTHSSNLYDPSGDTYGIIISSSGVETVNGRWKTSDYIPYPGGYITVTSASAYQVGDGAGFIAWYDSNKNFVTRSQAYGYTDGYKTYSRNDSAYYRVCSAIETERVMVNVGQTLLPYTPYGIICSDPMSEIVQRMIDDNTMPPSAPVWSSMHIPEMAEIDSDYQGIATYNPTLTELYALYDALVTAYPDYITKTDLGLDQSGSYHLYSYSFVPESVYISNTDFTMPKRPKIMLCSGTHGDGSYGDKPEMVVALYYFFKNLCDNWTDDDGLTYLRWNVQFEVIPVQNPWGYVNKDRKNSRGVDINRNFLWGWRSGTSGNRDYGGTAPFSEAESVIIKDFIEDNLDAIAYLDVHTVGGVPDQDKMIYFDQVPNDTLSVIASDTIIEVSRKWNSENIGGLTNIPFHGYIDDDGPLGKIYQWAYKVCGIPAMVFEGFPSFQNSTETVDGDVIMLMCLDEILAVVLKTLAFYKHYNVKR